MRKLAAIICFAFFCLLPVVPALASVNIQTVKSPGGIKAWLVEDHSVPVLSISFAFEGGISMDPDDRQGLANLLSTLLDEGAGEMDSQTFQAELQNNAIDMSFSAGRDQFFGHIKTLTPVQDKAFNLLRLALSKPRFDADAIERMKNATLNRIRSNRTDPRWIAARTFNGKIYEGHAYARPGAGTLDSVPTITAEDLRSFAGKYFTRDTLKISVAGDITAPELAKALDIMFGRLPESTGIPELPAADLQYPGKTIMIRHPVPQTFIQAGQPGMKRHDPDWHAANIINHALGGGGFGSRLMEEIREKRGLTYGVYSRLESMDHADMLSISLSTRNQAAGEAISLIYTELAKMAHDGMTEDELANTKSYLIGALPLQMTSTGDVAGVLLNMQIEELGIDYLDRRTDEINAVTLEDIRRVAARLLQPGKLTMILVGEPENVTADIELEKPPGIAD